LSGLKVFEALLRSPALPPSQQCDHGHMAVCGMSDRNMKSYLRTQQCTQVSNLRRVLGCAAHSTNLDQVQGEGINEASGTGTDEIFSSAPSGSGVFRYLQHKAIGVLHLQRCAATKNSLVHNLGYSLVLHKHLKRSRSPVQEGLCQVTDFTTSLCAVGKGR
jgi:hypothetical protein